MAEVNLGDIFWRLGIKSTVKDDVFSAEAEVSKLEETEKSSTKAGKDLSGSMLKVGAAMTGAGIGAKLLADNINASYLSFDTAMAEVKSLGGLTVDQFEDMEDASISLSKQLPISATEVAGGMYMMRSAGFDANKVLAEMPAIADMAVAGNLRLGDAVNATTAVLDSYGTKAGDAEHITDVLIGTVQAFKTTLPELQQELSKNIGVAANLGIQFEELSAMNGMLKKDFVSAEEAGTALKSMLMKLSDPSQAQKFADIGISVKDANGDFIGMEAVLDQLSVKLDEAGGNVDQMGMLTQLFGAEGVRAAMSLVRQRDELGVYSDALREGGQVQEALTAQLEATGAQLEIADNKMEAAKITMGDAMAPATILTADAMGLLAGGLEALPGPIQTVAGVGLQLSQGLTVLGPLLMTVSAIQTSTMVPALMATAAAGWAAILPWLPLVAAIAGVVAIGYLLWDNWEAIAAGLTAIWDGLADAWAWLTGASNESTDQMDVNATELDNLGNTASDTAEGFDTLTVATEDTTDAVSTSITDYTDYATVLSDLGDEMSDLKETSDDLNDSLRDNSLSLRGNKLDLADAKDKLAEMRAEGKKENETTEQYSRRIQRQEMRIESLGYRQDDLIEKQGDINEGIDENSEAQKENLKQTIDAKNGQEKQIESLMDLSEAENMHSESMNTMGENMANSNKSMADDTEGTLGLLKTAWSWTPIGMFITHFGEITDFFKDHRDEFYDAGVGLMEFLVNGIKSLIMKPYEVIWEAMGMIGDLLPHSPAKRGPLSKSPDWEAYLVKPLASVAPSMDSAAEAAVSQVSPMSSSEVNTSTNNYDDSMHIDQINFSNKQDVDEFWQKRDDQTRLNLVKRGVRS